MSAYFIISHATVKMNSASWCTSGQYAFRNATACSLNGFLHTALK